MSKYLEVEDGLSVKKSEIESVQRREDGFARIVLNSGKEHETSFSYKALLIQLEAVGL